MSTLTANQKVLKNRFEESYVRGVGSIVYQRHGRVMWFDDLNIEDKTLTVKVYSDNFEALDQNPDKDNYLVFEKVYTLTPDVFDTIETVSKNLYETVGQFEADLNA